MATFLDALKQNPVSLRPTQTKGGHANLNLAESEPTEAQDEHIRDYFFQAGVDEWYNKLEGLTFRSEFVKLDPAEAREIVRSSSCSYDDNTELQIPSSLQRCADNLLFAV